MQYDNALYLALTYARDAVTSSGFWTAVATIVIAAFTVVLSKAARRQSEDARVIQRAYVRMSHRSDAEFPGLNPTNKKVSIEIKNFGKTPARVMGVRLGPVIRDNDQSLPAIPPYLDSGMVDHPAAQAFLQADGDHFNIRQGLAIEPLEWGAVTREVKTLYVIGLVEYVDIFGVWHRAGYARRYAHGRPENNLTFVSEGAYSYDIVISKGERLTGK